MVKSCSAYGCTNRYGKIKENVVKEKFHSFPLNKPLLLNRWLIAMRRKSWTPNKHSLLCSDHFTDDCYKSSAKRYLKDDAVPSLFSFPDQKVEKKKKTIIKYSVSTSAEEPRCDLKTDLDISQPDVENSIVITSVTGSSRPEVSPLHVPIVKEEISQPNEANSNAITSEISQLDVENSIVITSVAGSSTPEVSPVHVLVDKEDVKSKEVKKNSPTKAMLRRKIKILQQKLNRRDKKIKSLLNIISVASKVGEMTDETSNMLREKFGPVSYELLVNEVKNSNCKPKARRFSSSMKEFALTLYYYSPKSYVYLRKSISLPHPSVVRSWVNSAKV